MAHLTGTLLSIIGFCVDRKRLSRLICADPQRGAEPIPNEPLRLTIEALSTVRHTQGDGSLPMASDSDRVLPGGSAESQPLSRPLSQSVDEDRPIRWQRGHLLGRGAFGSVYMGLCLDTGKFFAAKQVRSTTVREGNGVVAWNFTYSTHSLYTS